MKKTTTILSSLILCAALTGCVSPGSIVSAMGKDPASVHVRVSTIYGTIDVTRTNPQITNTLPHTIAPDGTISVDKAK